MLAMHAMQCFHLLQQRSNNNSIAHLVSVIIIEEQRRLWNFDVVLILWNKCLFSPYVTKTAYRCLNLRSSGKLINVR